MYSDDLKEYQNLCLDKNSVVVGYNVDKYCDFLLRKGRIQSKCDFYMGTFTLVRDSFYLKNEVNLIEEVNKLKWIDMKENFFDYNKFAGEGNIGHIMIQIKKDLNLKIED